MHVGVEQADGQTLTRQGDGEVDGDGRLADAAFARGYGYDVPGILHQQRSCIGGRPWLGPVRGQHGGRGADAGLAGQKRLGLLPNSVHGCGVGAVGP